MQNVTTASLRLRKRWWREETLELVEDWTKSVPFEPNRTAALMSSQGHRSEPPPLPEELQTDN